MAQKYSTSVTNRSKGAMAASVLAAAGLLLTCNAESHGAAIAAWSFDGTAGTANPSVVSDISGNANHLSLGSVASYNSDVPLAYASNTSLDLTGAGVNDRASDDALTVGRFANNAAWSISVWFKTSTTGVTQQIVSQRKNSTGNGWRVALDPSGKPLFSVQGQTSSDGRVAIGANGVANGQWHHLAAVNDPNSALDANGDGELLLYLDGALLATDKKVQPNAITYDNSVLSIGNGRDLSAGNHNGFTGLIDEAVLFNHALSAAEVSTLFATSIVPEPATPAIALLAGAATMLTRRRQNR